MCDMGSPSRVHLVESESSASPRFWDMMKWLCMCMHRRGSDNSSVTLNEMQNLLITLSNSPESQPKKGQYVALLPYMTRIAMYDDKDKDCDGVRIPENVLKFTSKSGVCLRTGLYTCKLHVKLSNTSWRLGCTDFIQGRGICTVSAYLFDLRFIQPLPGGADYFRFMDSIQSAFWSMCTISTDVMPRHLQEEGIMSEHKQIHTAKLRTAD